MMCTRIAQSISLLICLSFSFRAVAFSQGKPAERRTPLGTQRPVPPGQSKPVAEPKPDPLDKVVQRALEKSGGKQAMDAVADSISTGTITWFDAAGAGVSFPITLTRKGDQKIQLQIKQPTGEVKLGTDGTSTWNSWNGFSVEAGSGPALGFLESHTVRSPKNLFDADAKAAKVRDRGIRKDKEKKQDSRVVELEDKAGRKTSYLIDNNSNIVGLEFALGERPNPFGGVPLPDIESYRFDDFRAVRGVQTPHTITHYRGGIKVEEIRLSNVQHNMSVPDSTFRR
jgi:hypothetical protein